MANTSDSRQALLPQTLLAKDVMSTSLLAAHESWTVAELAHFLVSNGITGAPVLDDDEQLLGVVSVTDVARFTSMEQDERDERGRHGYYTDSLDFDSRLGYLDDEYNDALMEATTVTDIMTPAVFDVDAQAPVNQVARDMVANGIHRVFVRDRGRIVGVVSALDILKLVAD